MRVFPCRPQALPELPRSSGIPPTCLRAKTKLVPNSQTVKTTSWGIWDTRVALVRSKQGMAFSGPTRLLRMIQEHPGVKLRKGADPMTLKEISEALKRFGAVLGAWYSRTTPDPYGRSSCDCSV